MNGFSRPRSLQSQKQPFLENAVVAKLILRNMNNHDADLVIGKVLLVLYAAVDCDDHVELLLRDGEKRSVLQRIPALLVNGGDLMIFEESLDARIYALVNEDAHSRS